MRLNGLTLPNDSLVDIDDIPDDASVGFVTAVATALMCRTDLFTCCSAGQQGLPQNLGEWYHPDGSGVTFNDGNAKFRINRQRSDINLWRTGHPMQQGRFRCELLDAQNVNQIRYVNICELSH